MIICVDYRATIGPAGFPVQNEDTAKNVPRQLIRLPMLPMIHRCILKFPDTENLITAII